jgi:hypothetical protein
MENNFNISVFRDNVAKNIVISDDMAKRYYLENQKKLFNVPPFAKEIGGIAAQIIPITDHQKSLKDLASLFSNKKDGFTIEGFFPELENSHVDEIFKKALIEMKIGQIRVVSLDGQFFAIKKIRDANGLWNDYDQVAEKVQYVLKKELIDKKCAELIADYEEKLKIEVCQKGVADYIENKVNEFKGIIDYVENDLQELEASGEKNTINESSVKEVIQKEVEIV